LKDSELRTLLQDLANDYLDATEELGEEDDASGNSGREQSRHSAPARFEENSNDYNDDYRDRDQPRGGNTGYGNEGREYNTPRSYDAPSRQYDSPRSFDQPQRSYEPRSYESRPAYEAGRGGNYDAPGRDTGNRGNSGGYFEGRERGGYENPRDQGRYGGGAGRGNFESRERGGFEAPSRGGYEDRSRQPQSQGWDQRPTRDDVEELTLINDRCRLKAKGARWAAERRRMINNGVDFRLEIDPKDREIITIAKQLPECFLWMNHPSGPSPANLNMFDDLAGCYDTMGDTVLCIREMLPDAEAFPEIFNKALDLAAEAQSALRAAVYRIDGPNDNDQNAVFHWLKRTASHMQIFIQRFMRADDTANPTKYAELSDRVRLLERELTIAKKKDRERAKLLSKVRPLIRDLAMVEEANRGSHWHLIANAVDEAINSGLPVTDSELRALLSPLVRQVPTGQSYPEGFLTVLSEYEHSANPVSLSGPTDD
jgi:hypothetical protein